MSGFPPGYFVVLSLATVRLLDVEGGRTKQDGTEIILYPSTDTSSDSKLRNPWFDNQVFFVDESGHMRSKASHFPIDIDEDHLVIRSEDLVKENSISLPRFSYSPETKQITILQAPSTLDLEYSSGDDKSYLLVSVPKSNPRVSFENGLYALLPPSGAYAEPDEDSDDSEGDDSNDGEIAVNDIKSEVDPEVDDSLDWIRRVKVAPQTKAEGEAAFVIEQAKKRLTWAVIPLKNGDVQI